MPIKIEAGKCYRTHDGERVGPMEYFNDYFARWPGDPHERLWVRGDGACSSSRSGITAEWSDEPEKTLAEIVQEAKQQVPDTNPLHDLLEEAIATVTARGKPYGGVEDNFGRIARLWHAHLANRYGAAPDLDAIDVALMMALVKVARLANDPTHRDSWVDIAGYAACGGSLAKKPLDSV